MFRRSTFNEAQATLDALSRSQAIIEFSMGGAILGANKNFLDVVGYDLVSILGKEHRIFVDEREATDPSYAELWSKLRAGQYISGEFLRKARSGANVWLQASYNPVFGADGKPFKVV